jgi:type VI secretion system secreted protein VgrG
MAEASRTFHFHSDALPDDTFMVSGLEGVETFNRPYEFQIDLVSKKADVNLESVLKEKAHLAVRQTVPLSGGKQGTRIYKIHGVVAEMEVLEQAREWVHYRVLLVPRLWKLGLTTQSRVFQDLKIGDLIQEVLKTAEGAGLSKDFELKLNASYQKREFVVQYNETDLDFLHRWCEHEGVFYYFEQTENGEKLVFGDGTAAYAQLPGNPAIPYRPVPEGRSKASGALNEETLQEQSVFSFVCRWRKTPKQVVLKDYNYRTPSVEMKAEAKVENPAGDGKVFVYGEHFKTAAEGGAIAKVRAEEFQCRDKVFEGVGDHRSFRPGTTFPLSGHFRTDFNADYCISRVTHKVAQGTAASSTGGGQFSYENRFTCIPSSDVFRPERATPWPAVYGFLNARIDAGGSGDYAEIDDQGRYKVKLPFDLSDRKDGKASRFIRMAQPYAGANMGMHFPLHKNTEVLLSFVDGDVDRPIIASAVPNAETPPPVTSGNQSQCAIRTGGGNQLVIEDTDGNQRIKMETPHSQTFFQMGSKNDPNEGISAGTETDITFQSARDYVRRTGRNVTIEISGNEHKITKGDSSEETEGNKKEWTRGNTESETVGNSKETTVGNKEETTTGNSKSTTVGSTDETFTGSKTSKSLSDENEMTLGVKNSMSASAENETKVGASSSMFGGIQFESTNGLVTEISKGGKLALCEATDLETANMALARVTGENKTEAGSIVLDAHTTVEISGMTSVTLKCGPSEIKISPSGIELKGPQIKFDAQGMLEAKSSGMVKIQGSVLDVTGQAMHK